MEVNATDIVVVEFMKTQRDWYHTYHQTLAHIQAIEQYGLGSNNTNRESLPRLSALAADGLGKMSNDQFNLDLLIPQLPTDEDTQSAQNALYFCNKQIKSLRSSLRSAKLQAQANQRKAYQEEKGLLFGDGVDSAIRRRNLQTKARMTSAAESNHSITEGLRLRRQYMDEFYKEYEEHKQKKDNVTPKKAKKKDNVTPTMLFRKKHLELRDEGEQWMKNTAQLNTIIATIIITLTFGAGLTLLGGNNDATRKAVYATKSGFTIFTVSDAISLITSTISLWLSVSILISRYGDENLLTRFVMRLLLGLVMLFLSLSSFMVAFCASFFITYGQEKAWILILVAASTCLVAVSTCLAIAPRLIFKKFEKFLFQLLFKSVLQFVIRSMLC